MATLLFHAKIYADPFCNSVCRTENIVGYRHDNDNLRVHQTIYPLRGGTSACFMAEKLEEITFKIPTKKIGE